MSFIPPDGVEFREGRPMSTTESGVPYVSFITANVVAEGDVSSLGYATMDEAWGNFNAGMARYLTEQRAKVVEWRIPPTDDSRGEMGSETFHRIRARLAIVERYEEEAA